MRNQLILDRERICFDKCTHSQLCYLKRGLGELLRHANVNINTDDAPAGYLAVWVALANCCLDFEAREESDD